MIEMQEYLQHPSEDALERFVLHNMREEELEGVESHIMACEDCVSRLEFLEIQVAATKVALSDLHQTRVEESYAKQKKSGWAWLKISGYSLAGVAAAAVLAIANLPSSKVVERDISAYRGVDTIQLPAQHPLFLHLNVKDLTAAPVDLQVVTAEGSEIWKGGSAINNQTVDAHIPKISDKGNYFLRLYALNQNHTQGNLLKEFAIQVQ